MRVLVALTVVGVALTGLVVWITTPPSTGAGAGTALDARALAAADSPSGLSPVGPGPTLARSAPGGGSGGGQAGTGAGDGVGVASPASAPGPTAIAAASSASSATVPNCTPVSLAQRAARTLIVGIPDVTDPSDPMVKKVLDIGVGGIFLNPGNVESEAQVIRLIRGIRGLAGRPIVITVDEEPGRVSSLGDIVGASSSARRMANEGPASDVRAYAHHETTA